MKLMWFIVGLVVIMVAAYIYQSRLAARLAERARGIAELARQQNWSFAAQGETVIALCERLPAAYGRLAYGMQDALFREKVPARRPVRLRAENVTEALIEGSEIMIFDFTAMHLAYRDDKKGLQYRHNVWAIKLSAVPFSLQAATKNQRQDRWMGVGLRTGDHEFDKKFHTVSDGTSNVGDWLSAQARSLLLKSGFDGWRLEPRSGHLLLWTYKRLVPAAEFMDYTRKALQLARAVPHVQSDVSGDFR